MAQNFTDDCFAPGNAGQTDLQNMENNFQALKTCFSGSSTPSNTTAGMPFARLDSTLLRVEMNIRNYANTGWSVLGVDVGGYFIQYGVFQYIRAGTGLTGGGWLYNTSASSYVTDISVASSGIDSAQIKDKAVTPSKLSEIGKAPAVVVGESSAYNYAVGAYIPFVCPTGPSTIGVSLGLSQLSTAAAARAYAVAYVTTTAGTTATGPSAEVGGSTFVGVFKTSTLSISATALTPGSTYMLAVLLRGGSTGQPGYMTGVHAVWT